MKRHFEIPPTAGLPPLLKELFGLGHHLADKAAQRLGLVSPQTECSGTASLIVALKTLRRICQRLEVIIPAYTCPLVPMAIAHCGLTIKLCDLAPNHFDFDFDHLSALVNENTLAIIPTHLGGRVADTASVQKLATACGACVIEDAAQALGAQVGEYGDITFYSLAIGKGLSIFEGGLLTAKDSGLQEQLRQTSQEIIPFRFLFELRRCLELIGYTLFYRPHCLYYAYGLPRRKALQANNLEAAVGDIFDFDIPLHHVSLWRQGVGAKAIQRLPEFILKTRAQGIDRAQRLSTVPGIQVMSDTKNTQGVWPFLMLLMPDNQTRDVALEQLWQTSLGVTRLFINALPDYAYLGKIVPQEAVPNARDFAARLLTISNSLWLDDMQFEQICQTIEQVISQRSFS